MKNPTVAAAISLEKVKGDIVTETLDTLNKPGYTKKKRNSASAQTAMSGSYEFSKSVLSAAYDAKGIVLNGKS